MGNKCTIQTESCGFSCTGFDGSDVWAKRMAVTESISCDTCRDHAVKDESAFHDHVNAGLGEKIFDPANYKRFHDEVVCVYSACKARGDCI